jgi:crotonobetainyl-CoA:carnitine CoA-transferase CaiB-like acyl-CoA transferase
MAERVFRAIGRPDMIEDPRFRTNTDRVRHIDECDGAVAAFIAERTLDQAMAVFSAAEVTATPVYEIDQLVADPHIQERSVIVEVPDAEAGSVLMHNVIPGLSATPGRLRRPAPALGAHSGEVLRKIGYSEERIAALREEGVVKLAELEGGR